MPWVYIICFALIAAGLLTLFGVRPGDFIDALFRSQRKSATLTDELNVLMGTPAKGFFNQDFELKQILKGTGRADRYEAVKRLTLILFAVGGALALLIGNVYMVPILGIGFSLAPIWYLRSTAASYKKHLNEELETAIFNEWMLELSFENWHEWFAMIRFAGYTEKPDFTRLLALNKTLREALEKEYEKSEAQGDNYYQRIIDRRIDAIPSSEISSNLECKQNPGY